MKPLLAGLLLVLTACTAGSNPTTTASTLATTAPTTTAAETTSTSGAETTTTTAFAPLGIDGLPDAMREQILTLIDDVQRIRELRFLEPLQITLLTSEELSERVRTQIEEETEDVEADQALYVLLGLLPPGTDLLALYSDFYGASVAGFYDGEERELVVPAGSEMLTPLQRGTLIHELTHALADQHHGMSAARKEMIDAERFDEAAAFLALIEGDATLVEILYLQEMSRADQEEFLAESFATDSSVFDAAPIFLQKSLLFPYQEGFAFTQRLYDVGGFAAVDEAYANWPVSTEQVLTPRDYLRDLPIAPEMRDLEVVGHELVYDSDWGELGFLIMFEQILGEGPEANEPAEGWGGDRFRLWFDGVNVVMLIEYVGDTERDATELSEALVDYALAGMAVGSLTEAGGSVTLSGDDYAYVSREGANVTFVAAGDPSIGADLVAALGG